MRFRLSAAVLACVLAGSADLSAQVTVFDNSTTNIASGGPFYAGPYTVAVRFLSGTPLTFNAIRYWGGDHGSNGSTSTSINWSIFQEDPSAIAPGAVVSTGSSALNRTAAGMWFTTYNLYQFDFSVPWVSLASGAYWLALNLPSTSPSIYSNFWSSKPATAGVNYYRQYTSTSSSASLNGDVGYAFIQNGPPPAVTPEPVTMILMGTGLAGIAGAARRRRRKQD